MESTGHSGGEQLAASGKVPEVPTAPKASSRVLKRTKRESIDKHQKRLRNASTDYPPHVRGNCIYSRMTTCSYQDVYSVSVADHHVQFDRHVLQVEPPELDMEQDADTMKFWLNYRELQPGCFRCPITTVTQMLLCTTALVEAVALLYSTTKPQFSYETREQQLYAGDSGDDAPLDSALPSPFTGAATVLVNNILGRCWEACGRTQQCHFQNALGNF